MSKAVMQQALEALVTCCAEEWRTLNNFGMRQVYDEKKVNAAIAALHAALAEPRPIEECYGDCPTNPQTCPNPCNFEGRPKPEPIEDVVVYGSAWSKGGKRIDPMSVYKEPEQIGYARCPRCWEPITAPTPRKPLTYDELEPLCEAFDSYDTTQNELVEFARAIEQAHGITGESK